MADLRKFALSCISFLADLSFFFLFFFFTYDHASAILLAQLNLYCRW